MFNQNNAKFCIFECFQKTLRGINKEGVVTARCFGGTGRRNDLHFQFSCFIDIYSGAI